MEIGMEQGKKNRVLDIQNLELQLPVEQKYYPVVQQLSIYVEEGEMVALVGESGCGKSMTAMASIGLQPAACKASGRIEAGGKNLLSCTEKEWETLRGSETAMFSGTNDSLKSPSDNRKADCRKCHIPRGG